MKYIDVNKLKDTICKTVKNLAMRGRLNALINEQPLLRCSNGRRR